MEAVGGGSDGRGSHNKLAGGVNNIEALVTCHVELIKVALTSFEPSCHALSCPDCDPPSVACKDKWAWHRVAAGYFSNSGS